jgi:hypothetical protein
MKIPFSASSLRVDARTPIATGQIHREGKIGSTSCELDSWIKTLPQPRMIAMEATIFTGLIYDHLLPYAEKVKVANPLMLRAIAAAKRKNDRIIGHYRNSGFSIAVSTSLAPLLNLKQHA